MTRGSFILALAFSVTCGVGMLEPSPAPAAEPAPRIARLGFVAPYSDDYSALWERLRELSWVEGQNFIIEARHAEGHIDRLPALMADVVGRRVEVIITVGHAGRRRGQERDHYNANCRRRDG